MKAIKGFETSYAITRDGRVWSFCKHDWKATQTNTGGYEIVRLWKNNESKWYTIHRLVAETYLPNPNHYPVINHKDQNKLNNNVDNLEWASVEYNVQYSCCKRVMCQETGEIFDSVGEAAKSVGRKPATMSAHLHGNSKSCGGYHFEFTTVMPEALEGDD